MQAGVGFVQEMHESDLRVAGVFVATTDGTGL
jgi:hypothetical protein